MKKQIIWVIIILIIAIVIFMSLRGNEQNESTFNQEDFDIGKEFTKISYPNKMYVLNYEIVDITGDGEKDMVLIIGEKEDLESNRISNIDVVVCNSKENNYLSAEIKNFSGNNPQIRASDMTGDGISDISVITENGDGTYNVKVFTYSNTKLEDIFKDKNNKGIVFDGKFEDGFRVKLLNRKLNKNFTMQLTDRKDNYIKIGFYGESGKLKKENVSVGMSGFTSVELIKLNDRYGISTNQRITGFDDLDIIDEVQVIWKYEDGKWQMKEAKGTKIGNLLY